MELGQVISNATTLALAYQSVLRRYSITWADFDIEGQALTNAKSIDIRNQALVILKNNNPALRISYTLPVLPTGLTNDGLNLLKSAIKYGVTVDEVNIMAMNYGIAVAPLGAYAIQAATATYAQIQQLGLKATIGVTPMVCIYKADHIRLVSMMKWMKSLLNRMHANSLILLPRMHGLQDYHFGV